MFWDPDGAFGLYAIITGKVDEYELLYVEICVVISRRAVQDVFNIERLNINS